MRAENITAGKPDDGGVDKGDVILSTKEQLSSSSRLFDPDASDLQFSLGVFRQSSGTIALRHVIPVGSYRVFDSFSTQWIEEASTLPYAFLLSFLTDEGRIMEWVIFPNPESDSASDSETSTNGVPTKGIEQMTLKEHLGSTPRIGDIDGDGIVDIILHEKVFEVGIGYETYLTWYRWNGELFEQEKMVNIVRSLRTFLDESFTLLRNGKWREFSDRVKPEPSEEIESYRAFLFDEVLELIQLESFTNDPIGDDERIRRAVYPNILENPFARADETGSYFPLNVRFETRRGKIHFYRMIVYLSSNPFVGDRFFFGRFSRP